MMSWDMSEGCRQFCSEASRSTMLPFLSRRATSGQDTTALGLPTPGRKCRHVLAAKGGADSTRRMLGWSLNIIGPWLLELPSATVRDQILAPDGPGYKLLAFEGDAFTSTREPMAKLSSANKILEFAKAGLPILIAGDWSVVNAYGVSTQPSSSLKSGADRRKVRRISPDARDNIHLRRDPFAPQRSDGSYPRRYRHGHGQDQCPTSGAV